MGNFGQYIGSYWGRIESLHIMYRYYKANNFFFKKKDNSGSITEFSIGIILLMIVILLSAVMGLFQEITYEKYGKHWREGLFYTVSNKAEGSKQEETNSRDIALSRFTFFFVLFKTFA